MFDQLEAESFMTNQRQDSSGQSELHFKRKINGKKVTRRFDDSMSSLSNAKEISMNWWYIYRKKKVSGIYKVKLRLENGAN